VVIHFAKSSTIEAGRDGVRVVVAGDEGEAAKVLELPLDVFAGGADGPREGTGAVVATVPPPARAGGGERLTVVSDWKVDPELAREDLEGKIRRTVSEWLGAAGVPADWAPPRELIGRVLAGEVTVTAEDRDYARLHRASREIDASPELRHAMVQAYRRHAAAVWMGGGLAFALAALTIVTGYIRTDEATKGYYTNRLRILAAAGLGGAGVLLWQWVTRAL
jgi:hypothetical protein